MFGIDDVLTGGLSLLGGVANNMFAGSRQNDAQAFNAQQASINRDFQERMANTQYQRSADDMQKAGLNRILAVGHGASVPSGSSASSSPGAPVHDMLGPAVNTAMAHTKLKEEVSNMKETNKNIAMDTDLKRANFRKSIAEGTKVDVDAQLVRDQNAIVVENLSEAQLKAARSKVDREQMSSPAFQVLRKTGNVGEEIQRSSSALGNVPALINAGSNARKNKYIRTGE